ncbi:MAG: recombination mediator RecR [Candidatus Roizmanbacteria bacterium]
MATLPNSLRQVSLFLERLPGIGEKTANRLAFYLLRLPDSDLNNFSEHIARLKARTKKCTICLNLTEDDICTICADQKRRQNTILVIEDVLDLLSFESGRSYDGIYHVLHGRIDPLNHIGPDDIFIDKLYERVKNSNVEELILAMNPDMEGEATALYIRKQLDQLRPAKTFKVTRLAYGLPIGGNVEYADYMTLRKAIENRNQM